MKNSKLALSIIVLCAFSHFISAQPNNYYDYPDPEPEPQYPDYPDHPNEPTDQGFPGAVIDDMSSREERYHHYLWHNIRDNWNRWDASTQDEIRQRGWEPPRPARSYDQNGAPTAITDNNSGEDFLYMHRQMINRVRNIAGSNQGDHLTGWQNIPPPGDSEWPVPPEYQIDGSPSLSDAINSRKSDSFYYDQLISMEDLYTDPNELQQMTLGELGSRIENTIHNWLHLRFSSESSIGYRPGDDEPFPYIDPMWDDPSYQWLGDTYSSHVNPVFWKLHGWVDDRIEDWRNANGIGEIQWIGTWEGGPMSTLSDILDVGQQQEQQEQQEQAQEEQEEGISTQSLEVGGEVISPFADDVQVNFGSSGTLQFKSQPVFKLAKMAVATPTPRPTPRPTPTPTPAPTPQPTPSAP